jgi:RHS repeat-associated protein
MKRLTTVQFQTIVLFIASSIFLISGAHRAQDSVQANATLSVDQPFFTLVNDIPVNLTLRVDPPGVTNVKVHFLREGMVETIHSVNILPLDGTMLSSDGTHLTTDSTGTAHIQLQAGYGGQGLVWCAFETASGAPLMIDGVITSPKRCDCCCDRETDCCADSQDTGNNSVQLYSGERMLRITALTVPGVGFDYQAKLQYRGEVSNLRAASTNDFGVDWSMSYVDDRLLQDKDNVIVSRGDSLRNDMFIAAGSGVFVSPMEYYEQLTVNSQHDYELRSQDGMVKTYKGFVGSNFDGRLTSIQDRSGNVMRFNYGQPPGLNKTVLMSAEDTEGRRLKYNYFPNVGATFSGSSPGEKGRLKEIVDLKGRSIKFEYDEKEGNLVSLTSPTVEGFPQGKTFRYAYTTEQDLPGGISGINRERLLHNLVAVEYPNETVGDSGPAPASNTSREILTYETDPNKPDSFDHVHTYTIGGTNGTGVPAGGTITYTYETVGTMHATHLATPNDVYFKTTVVDRRGNVTEYQNSAYDTLIKKSEFTSGFRKGEPAAFITQAQYNKDKLLVHADLPAGNGIDHIFAERSDRFQQGNEIRTVRTADAARGGDQKALFTETIFEPIYQQPAAVTDSRGLDPSFVPPIPDPRGRSQRERYTTRYFFDYQEGDPAVVLPMLAATLGTSVADVQARLTAAGVMLGLGDLNGDGDTSAQIAGNVVRKDEASAVLLPGSHQAGIQGGDQFQGITTRYRYNQFGQMTSMIDPEGNIHTNDYFPQTDPDGDGKLTPVPDGRTLDTKTGGYLKEEVVDAVSDPSSGNFSDPARNNHTNPKPVSIRTAYTYDEVGNRTSITDGRGIRTDYVVNELNQVVQIVRAAAIPASGGTDVIEPLALTGFAYRENIVYDANNNVVRREVEDRGNTSNTGGFVDYTYKYDILDNLVESSEEVSITETFVTRHQYDANGNRTLTIQPEGNATTNRYDERDLVFQSTRGAMSATTETLGAPAGPYNPRGGVPSTMTFNYDRNRNLIEQVDAADTDASSGNGSSIAGVGDVTTFHLDGFDRRVATIDAVGNQLLVNYDPVSKVVKETRLGPIGGASPKNNSGAGNVTLSVTEYQYDEMSRLFQEDRLLFVSPGIITQRPANIADGELTPGDNKVTTRTEYDRKSRVTFRISDALHTHQTDYDGADRAIKSTDPEGNIVETAYDSDNNVIETRETDVSQVPGVPDEKFLTTRFYDGLNRLQLSVDNVGQATEYRYDSRNNLVATADSKGPVTAATITRRAFPNGFKTVNLINAFGNVTLYSYDGIRRKTQQEQILTASHQGDGMNIGADIFGVKTTIPAPDPSQGGGDGKITIRSEWDRDSLLKTQTDDNGNQTQYSYDNLNRRVTETKGICVAPALADRCDPPTTIKYEYDPDDNVTRLTDENRSITDCTFDAINRRTACNITRASGVVGTTAVSYEYDGLSRLTRATDNNEPLDASDDSIITFAYDSLSRVIEETQKIGALPAKAISSAWEADDHRIGLIYPNGRELEYSFDGLDRLKTVGDKGAAKPIADYDYIGGRVAERRYPINGTRLSYLDDAGAKDDGYDGLRRTVQLRHLRDDNFVLAGFNYGYDRTNNKLQEDKQHDTKNNETYTYDAANRLINFNRATGGIAPLHSKWKLDGVGNWRKVDAEKRKHSSFNEIISRKSGGVKTAILSDDNGNKIDDGVLTLKWDYRNRLREVVRKPTTTTYAYDADGRRIRKVVTSSSTVGTTTSTTNFYLDGWQEIEERTGDDAFTQQYAYGLWIDEHLTLDVDTDNDGKADRKLFYHEDAKKSLAAVTDDRGGIVERYIYDAYGSVIIIDASGAQRSQSAVNNRYLFNGRRFDPESRLYYYRNRYLDPETGAFVHRDPLGMWTDEMNVGNAYTYVGNNPINHVDPLGDYLGDFNARPRPRPSPSPTPSPDPSPGGQCSSTLGTSCLCPSGWGCEAGFFSCKCVPPPGKLADELEALMLSPGTPSTRSSPSEIFGPQPNLPLVFQPQPVSLSAAQMCKPGTIQQSAPPIRSLGRLLQSMREILFQPTSAANTPCAECENQLTIETNICEDVHGPTTIGGTTLPADTEGLKRCKGNAKSTYDNCKTGCKPSTTSAVE